MSYNLNSIIDIKCKSKLELSNNNINLKEINNLTFQNSDTIMFNGSNLINKPYIGLSINPNVITANINLTDDAIYTIHKINTSDDITITLPTQDPLLGRRYIFKNISSNSNQITISTFNLEKINDSTSITFSGPFIVKHLLYIAGGKWIIL
jgi:hypothetical protein